MFKVCVETYYKFADNFIAAYIDNKKKKEIRTFFIQLTELK